MTHFPSFCRHRVSRLLRASATGLCFALFMVWGFLLGTVVLFTVGLLTRNPISRRKRFMVHVCRSWRWFTQIMVTLGVFTPIRVTGLHHLKTVRAPLLVANHVTLVDIVVLGGLIPHFNCVVKKTLWQHPFFGKVVRACDFVPNTGTEEFIAQCQNGFQQNRPLIVFPQGTRAPQGAPITFQRGAAQIADRTGAPIVPIHIRCIPPTLTKGTPWYRVPDRPSHLSITIAPPLVIPAHIQNDPMRPRRVRKLNRFMEHRIASMSDGPSPPS